MFRVIVSDAGVMPTAALQTALDDWTSKRDKWEDDNAETGQVQIADSVTEGVPGTFRWYDIRFEQTDTKANILQKLGDKLKNKVAWYRIGYHVCPHDEASPGPCTWDDQLDWPDTASIPDYAPTFL